MEISQSRGCFAGWFVLVFVFALGPSKGGEKATFDLRFKPQKRRLRYFTERARKDVGETELANYKLGFRDDAFHAADMAAEQGAVRVSSWGNTLCDADGPFLISFGGTLDGVNLKTFPSAANKIASGTRPSHLVLARGAGLDSNPGFSRDFPWVPLPKEPVSMGDSWSWGYRERAHAFDLRIWGECTLAQETEYRGIPCVRIDTREFYGVRVESEEFDGGPDIVFAEWEGSYLFDVKGGRFLRVERHGRTVPNRVMPQGRTELRYMAVLIPGPEPEDGDGPPKEVTDPDLYYTVAELRYVPDAAYKAESLKRLHAAYKAESPKRLAKEHLSIFVRAGIQDGSAQWFEGMSWEELAAVPPPVLLMACLPHMKRTAARQHKKLAGILQEEGYTVEEVENNKLPSRTFEDFAYKYPDFPDLMQHRIKLGEAEKLARTERVAEFMEISGLTIEQIGRYGIPELVARVLRPLEPEKAQTLVDRTFKFRSYLRTTQNEELRQVIEEKGLLRLEPLKGQESGESGRDR